METKRISTDIWVGRQDVTLTEILQLEIEGDVFSHKLKVSIKSDTYERQSHARVSRWNGNEWKLLHHLGNMKTSCGLVHYRSVEEKEFTQDRTELLRVAKEVLS